MRTVELTYAISGKTFIANPNQFVTASVPNSFDATKPTTYLTFSDGTNCVVFGDLYTVLRLLGSDFSDILPSGEAKESAKADVK